MNREVVQGALTAPAAIQLAANAADADGTLAKVDFYQGSTLIGTATNAPYTVTWSNVAAGNYTITAVATDDRGAMTTSASVPIIVNAPPVIAFTAPAEGASFIAPATVTLTASASDADGAVAKVEFFEGANLIAGMTQAPYSAPWQVATPGSYTLFAKATDDRGAVTQAQPVHVTVKANTPPSVTLTSPAPGGSFKAPATIPLAATASDADGTIAKVEFFDGASLIATVSSPPYGFPWTGASVGAHSLTAVATDNLGAKMISGAVTITVSAAAATMYYIWPDHLGTPRAITDQAQRIVWRWDNSDPFGANVPDENPSGLGTFQFPLRFPGTYADRETGLLQNYFRDLDPNIGRYIQSDPIGLRAGLNTYAYVGGNPLSLFDPHGLEACKGEWRRFKWNRDIIFNPGFATPDPGKPVPKLKTFPAWTCTCYWLCSDCTSPSLLTPDGEGLPKTSGRIFFDPSGAADNQGNVEQGNNCICPKPGPETSCGCPGGAK